MSSLFPGIHAMRPTNPKFWTLPALALVALLSSVSSGADGKGHNPEPAERAVAAGGGRTEVRFGRDEVSADPRKEAFKVGDALPDTGQMLGRSLGSLAVIALICLGLWLVARKLAARRDAPLRPGGGIRLVERLALGSKRSVCVVRTGGSFLVLGVSEAGIHLIMECPDEGRPDFRQALQQADTPDTGDGR